MGVVQSVSEQDGNCFPATGRQQMQHVLVLAKRADHLLRFSFSASIHVVRPSAGNDQKKMVEPRCGAPQSVCFPEIAGGLGLCTRVTPVTCEAKRCM